MCLATFKCLSTDMCCCIFATIQPKKKAGLRPDPYPSAMQPKLLIPGESPFLCNPRCTVRAGHAVQPLDAFVKLLASCPVRRCGTACRTRRIGRAGQGFCIPFLTASNFDLIFPRGIFRDTRNPLDSPPPGRAMFVIPVQPTRCSSA